MSLEIAIKKTSEYARLFGCRLTKEETEERLLGDKIYDLSNTNKTFKKRNSNKFLENKIKKAEILANRLIDKFDDILLIAVTGSVASNYPKRNDDIDLLVVTKKDRLWLTRLKVRWFVWRMKIPHRKWEESHEKNKFCFNMWLDTDRLTVPKAKRKLSNAVDLILMKPLINREKVYERMLIENNWVKKYVATGYDKKIKNLNSKVYKNRKNNWIDKLVNWVVFWPQYWFMKPKMKRELVDLKQAYFHPNG